MEKPETEAPPMLKDFDEVPKELVLLVVPAKVATPFPSTFVTEFGGLKGTPEWTKGEERASPPVVLA